MKALSHADAFEVLCLQAADDGRGDVLFGDSLPRARKALRPFMVGEKFPSVYLEFPLLGAPFLDVTVLYAALEAGTRIDSEAAAGAEGVIDWFSSVCGTYPDVCFGFEVDTKGPELPVAAIHFQPRTSVELVLPFCEAVGEPERADLYLELAERMPDGWSLSFFGMFRGRPGSPLRVCGYLRRDEKARCAERPSCLAEIFDRAGFSAYDETMLSQIAALLAASPGGIDFQFDIWPDGRLGDIFAIDIQFDIEKPAAVQACFKSGPAARVMKLLEEWGVADGRWKLGGEAAFARALPVEQEDGSLERYAFTLMPQWVKARWKAGALQPAKLYHLAKAGFTNDKKPDQ